MSKLPAFQFYPGDWKKDPGVQALAFHDRAVWFEILLLMHDSEERGKLVLNGKPMPEEALARLLGLDKQILTTTITTILSYGVASIDSATGALMNRRMVADEKLRQTRKECGKLGGNPSLLNQNSNQNPTTPVKQTPTPSARKMKNEDEESSASSEDGLEETKRHSSPARPPSVLVEGEFREHFLVPYCEATGLSITEYDYADALAQWGRLSFADRIAACRHILAYCKKVNKPPGDRSYRDPQNYLARGTWRGLEIIPPKTEKRGISAKEMEEGIANGTY